MEVVMGYENNGKHPNSLAQLRPVIDSERAREMQAKGAEKRRENKALRDAMRLSASEFKKIKEEVISEMPSAVDILKVQLVKAMQVEDQETIEGVFQVHVQQVYQCSEGMFGQSCKKGNIHLNEDGLIIEKQWIDEKRFVPIITDLRRNVQPIIRYKMNDILHTTDCSCGSNMLAVSAIEGRMDDLLTFEDKVIFPDFIRRAITGANSEIDNYQLIRVSDQKLNLFVFKHYLNVD